MGLVTKVIDKRVYPYSECASTVLDVLRKALERNATQVFTSHFVNSVESFNDAFTVSGIVKVEGKPNQSFAYDSDVVVLATGSPATFGKDSTALYVALGHHARAMTPSLVPIKTNKEPLKTCKAFV